MSIMDFPLYSLLFLLFMAIIVPLSSRHFDSKMKFLVLFTFFTVFILSLTTLIYVLRHGPYLYNVGSWGQKIGIQFRIDEFSTIMSLLLSGLTFLVMLYSIRDITHEIKPTQFSGYYTLAMLLLLSMLGMTITNDLFNTYVFMEILSITSCGIVSIKHYKENYMAAFRYLMLNTIGSLSFLLGLAMIYMVTGHLNMTEASLVITRVWELYPLNLLLSIGFMLTGLAIKAALFPLHVWLPDAHSSAPTPSSALLSGLVVKVYVFTAAKILFRVIEPEIIISLGVPTFITYFAALSMIMGSVFAIGQQDIKRILAYSSVAQIGYIFLGLGLASPQGLAASMFHVITHALMKSALFLSAGAIIYQTKRRNIKDLYGIGYEMPVTMGVFTIAALGMIGIPGINGFMSKIYLSFAALEGGKPVYLVVILISSFLNAVYYLPIIISAFCLQCNDGNNVMVMDKVPRSMLLPMMFLACACLVFGFLPQLIMDIIEKAVPSFFGLL